MDIEATTIRPSRERDEHRCQVILTVAQAKLVHVPERDDRSDCRQEENTGDRRTLEAAYRKSP